MRVDVDARCMKLPWCALNQRRQICLNGKRTVVLDDVDDSAFVRLLFSRTLAVESEGGAVGIAAARNRAERGRGLELDPVDESARALA